MLEQLRLLNEDRRFLNRLRAGMPPEDTRWMERVISGARLFFAVVALIAIYVDPTEPARYEELIYGLLISYVLLSIGAFLFAWFRAQGARPAWKAMHVADIAWFSIITTFSQGPNSPLYVFLLFLLLVAAYQWGFRETLATAGTIAAVLFTQVALLLVAPFMGRYALEGEFELNRFILRSAFLLLMGLLLGYLSEQEKVHQAEANLIARLLSRVQAERGLRATLDVTLAELLRVFGSDRAVLVLREKRGERVFLWEARRLPDVEHVSLQLSELDGAAVRPLFSSEQANTLYAQRSHAGGAAWTSHGTALDESGRRATIEAPVIPDSIQRSREARSMLMASLESVGEWRGRLILFDPVIGFNVELELRFLQKLMREVGPAAYSVYLVRQLRARVGAVERARVARELHDGAIQSLVALEMQMEVLRRPGAADPARVSEKLAAIQQLLHGEVLNLRELIEQIKPLEVGPQELLEHLTHKVEKFRRETGIAARFVCQIEEVVLPARAAREVSRIVQEALVNIRKHSAAHNVLVRLSASDSSWVLTIDDDGRGFGFSGRLSQAELDASRAGPVVIKERVRALGGELAIDSRPGKGARLEISIPQRTHA
jgi:signal transduction histidine kinase